MIENKTGPVWPLDQSTSSALPITAWRRLARFGRARATTTAASLLIVLALWTIVTAAGIVPPFILPGPAAVWEQFTQVVADGRLLSHTLTTVSVVLPGVLIGCALAAVLGYLIAKSPLAEQLIAPYLVASQAIPIIALAPLLTLWVPSTYGSRILVAVLVVFFPILVNVVTGLRGVSVELYDVMRSLRASRWQLFRLLELPAALPVLLGGLRVGVTLSVIGTLVGEFVQPRNAGLGFLLVTARYQFKTALVFVVLFTLAAIALTLYGAVILLERRLLRWQQPRAGL